MGPREGDAEMGEESGSGWWAGGLGGGEAVQQPHSSYLILQPSRKKNTTI